MNPTDWKLQTTTGRARLSLGSALPVLPRPDMLLVEIFEIRVLNITLKACIYYIVVCAAEGRKDKTYDEEKFLDIKVRSALYIW